MTLLGRIFAEALLKDNIVVDNDGNAVILDFGMSRLLFDTTRTYTNIQEGGHWRFLAPELASGQGEFRTSDKSDVFALGMVLYHLVYEKIPFHDILRELGASCAIREGKMPHRLRLPDQRHLNVEWQNLEERIWPVLEGTWAPQEIRSSLADIHASVCNDAFLEPFDDISNTFANLDMLPSLGHHLMSGTPSETGGTSAPQCRFPSTHFVAGIVPTAGTARSITAPL